MVIKVETKETLHPCRSCNGEAKLWSDGGWWRLEHLADYSKGKYGKWVSDATVSARLRELSAQGHPHETRPRRVGSSAVEYRRVRP